MSIDEPQKNKMMEAAPAKKQFFFAATAEHLAEVVYAETIQEAETIYQRVRRFIQPVTVQEVAPVVPAPEQSTAPAASVEEDVQ